MKLEEKVTSHGEKKRKDESGIERGAGRDSLGWKSRE